MKYQILLTIYIICLIISHSKYYYFIHFLFFIIDYVYKNRNKNWLYIQIYNYFKINKKVIIRIEGKIGPKCKS